jgi:GNAT superfamily N-acetyltransferase
VSRSHGAWRVRSARDDDSDRIAELCGQLGYAATSAEVRGRISALRRSLADGVFVADDPERGVVGWIHVLTAHRVESPAFAEIGGLVVDEGVRGRGVGEALVARAREWAAEGGLARLRVRTRADRADARAFYARLDFVEIKTQAVLDIDTTRD